MLSTTAQLEDLKTQVQGQKFIAIDTEFMREKTYYSKLCLIQIGFEDKAYAIDPLAEDIDLAPIFDIMADTKIVKVFHAARQDVEIFYQLAGAIPTPLFDTQIAAMVCGYGESVGYERLARDIARAQIDKTRQLTDWARRPLSDAQTSYALSDVTHLQVIYRSLLQRLAENGREPWLAEEMKILTTPATYEVRPDEAWKRLKLRSRNAGYLGSLIELARWRELRAQERDMPRNHVLRDEAIQELAAERPENETGMLRLRTVSKGLARSSLAQGILQAIAKGQARPKSDLPHVPKQEPTPKGIAPLIELLKVLLKLRAEEFDVSPKLIATSPDIEKIALDDAADVHALSGWRREIFGADALALKHGHLSLSISDGKLVAAEK